MESTSQFATFLSTEPYRVHSTTSSSFFLVFDERYDGQGDRLRHYTYR